MKKSEYLIELENELKKRDIQEIDDILSEYEDHFAFKLADGYSEEEIAHKLGNPIDLASQFENVKRGHVQDGAKSSRKLVTMIGLTMSDAFTAICFVLLWLWELVLILLTVAFGTLAVCLLFDIQFYVSIPPIPYGCGLIFGLSFIALTVLAAIGSVYFAIYLRQLMRAYARYHHNVVASVSGKPILPPVPTNPQLQPKTRRRLRKIALISLVIFAVTFVLGMIVSMFSAKTLQFWHEWGWFGYKN